MKTSPLHGMGPIVRCELALALSITMVRRHHGEKGTITIGKEEIDHLRNTFGTDAVYQEMDRKRGEGHDRTRTHETRVFVAGREWCRLEREHAAAKIMPPRVDEQRLAKVGLTYTVEGYRSHQGGARHLLHVDPEGFQVLFDEPRLAAPAAYFARLLIKNDIRIPRGVPTAARSGAQRALSRRSKYALRARLLLAAASRGERAYKAWRICLLRVMRTTLDKKRLLKPSDMVTIPAESLDSEEIAGFRDLRRRGLVRFVTDGRRAAAVVNLRCFAPYLLQDAFVVRDALGLGAWRTP